MNLNLTTRTNSKLSKNENSLFMKSFADKEVCFIDIFEDKFFLTIDLKSKKATIKIARKSFIKIISLLTDDETCEEEDEDDDEYEDKVNRNIVKYLICYIPNNNTSFQVDEYQNTIYELEAPYKKLLEKTKNYYINLLTSGSKKEEYKLNNKDKIKINSKSVEKICKYLNKSIFEIAHYMNILILTIKKKDNVKNFVTENLIKKYFSKNKKKESFIGVKNFETDYKIPLKNTKKPLNKIDGLFEKILNKLNKNDKNDKYDKSEDNDDSSELSNTVNNSFIKKESNISNDLNIVTDINISSNIINPNYIKNNDKIDEESKEECGCQKSFCPNCFIF